MRGQYNPQSIIDSDEDFKPASCSCWTVATSIASRPGALEPVIQSIREPADQWMTAADFRSFIDAQRAADQAYRDVDELDTDEYSQLGELRPVLDGPHDA